MLANSEFVVYIKSLVRTLSFVGNNCPTLPSFHVSLLPVLLTAHAMDVFIKALVGFGSLKTNVLLALNGDLLLKVTFQDIIYFRCL